ncbi:PEP/pyruvate-binding domain-containing protein [Brevundimonas diminuta]|uniref:PEP/pyruvate-binding domain-containing protein n=1 Tax=Brevundimonas diminuta TaxID=293 RepID=UPI003F7E2E87
MAIVLDYNAACASGAALVGGKAFTLARLASYGVRVPSGVIVTGESHAALVQVPVIAEAITEVLALTDQQLRAPPSPDGPLDRLTQAIIAQPPCDEGRTALRRLLAQEGLEHLPLAVRSSAFGEDGGRHSFAGIHLSVLNVQGEDAIWDAIRQCQASFWSARAVAYRRRAGLEDETFGGGVLICAMVKQAEGDAPLAAGVAFTCDPRTGDPDIVSIEAVEGLGDKLVDGRSTPCQATFSLRTGKIQVDDRLRSLLSVAQLEELARTALRIEWALSDGDDEMRFDIEWAHDGAHLVILQARPVTSTGGSKSRAMTTVEQIWSRANLTEVLPGVLTPFSWSLTRPGIRWTLLETYTATGLSIPPDLTMVKRILGRPYIELSAMQWLSYTRFGILPSQINESLGGDQPEIDVSRLSSGLSSQIQRAVNMVALLRVLSSLESTLRPAFAQSREVGRRLQSASLAKASKHELRAAWQEVDTLLLSAPLGLAAGAAVPWLTLAKTVLGKTLSTAEATALIGGLLADRGEVVSAVHGLELLDVARWPVGPERTAALSSYLERFGHRGYDELELANARWYERPAALDSVLSALQVTSGQREAAKARRDTADDQLKLLTPWRRRALQWLLPKIALGFRLREEARSENVRLLGCYRRIALEVGRRLHETGALLAVDDVFMLSVADISAYLNGDWNGDGALKLVSHRKAERRAWETADDQPAILREAASETVHAPFGPHTERKPVLKGIAASPGRARGIVRIVNNPEVDDFQPGEILVARATDPAWTPLFLAAAAIVVENGGYLSHGAIVAREFGIPAIVNVPQIRRTIRNGDVIEVDGDQGAVTIRD